MDWSSIISLIVQYGLPVAEALFQKWTTGAVPTQADFDTLNAMAAQNAISILKAQLTAAGITLTDPKALALLALLSPPPAPGSTTVTTVTTTPTPASK